MEIDFDAAERGDIAALHRYASEAWVDTVEYLRGWYCFSEAAKDAAERDDDDEAPQAPVDPEDRAKAVAYWQAVLARLDEEANKGRTEDDDRLEPIHAGRKVGRNDPCPCGSGKKYKKCCGGQAGYSPQLSD